MSAQGAQAAPHSSLIVSVTDAAGNRVVNEFTTSFRIGRTDQCEVCVKNDYVSRIHAEVAFDGRQWIIRDLESSNGLFLNGQRVQNATITRSAALRLGIEGPELLLEPKSTSVVHVAPELERPPSLDSGTILRRYVAHYF